MKNLGAALGSALLGWLMASLLLFITFKAIEEQSSHPWAYEVTAIALMIILHSLPVALISTATLGLAWHSFALKRGWLSRARYIVAGALMGAGVGLALSLEFLFFGFGWWMWVGIGVLYATVCGGFTGLYAWTILRPDRDAPNPPTSAS